MDNLVKAIGAYAQDPENAEKNYAVATIYFDMGQTAAALSYYLRTAERTDDKNLAYLCLLKIGLCFEQQGDRGNSVRGAYKHAVCLLPRRPEAYYLLARYYERVNDHVSGYLFAEQGLQLADFNLPPLRSWVEYRGRYCLVFQKAVSAWWWGKPDESRNLLLELWNEHDMDDVHRIAVENNLKTLNVPYDKGRKITYKKVFDNRKMDIVLQGQYIPDTAEIINEYLSLPFVNRIIVSHWRDDSITERVGDSRVIYVANDKPQYPGTDNRNLQIISSRNGLALTDTVFVAKMRSDQKYDSSSMLKMYDYMMDNHKPHQLFVAGMYNNLLFHPRDHIFWGKREDLIDLFNCPLEINGLADRVRISKQDMYKYYPFFTRSETYLGAHYIAQYYEGIKLFLIKPELYLYDAAPNWFEAKAVSDELTNKFFVPFPRTGIDLKWNKKGWATYPYELQAESGESWGVETVDDIDMGDNDEAFKIIARREINERLYDKFHSVKEGDVVVDFGANIGIFPYSLKNRKPKKVICVEPSKSLFKTLKENLAKLPFETLALNYGISDEKGVREVTDGVFIYGKPQAEFDTQTFKGFIEECNLDHIDFFKIDCEGGEYSVFTEENFEFLTTKVKYISGEWHFSGIENAMEKFREFRNRYLKDRKFRAFEPYRWKEVTNEIFDDAYLQRFYDFWHPHNGSAQLQLYIDNE